MPGITRIKRFSINTAGTDWVVGDIHGHFTRLSAAMNAVGFNPDVDRLFSVGDLIDRGPECRDVLHWLERPWFHPVRGNHDDYVVRFDTCDLDNWVYNGGAWFSGVSWDEQREYSVQFSELPIAIEVETAEGLIGILHADCPFPSWDQLRHALTEPDSPKQLRLVQNACMWSRSRVELANCEPVQGLRALIVGHTPLREPVVLGNVHHIDTAGWMPDRGYFTLMKLSTLECFPPKNPKLIPDWE